MSSQKPEQNTEEQSQEVDFHGAAIIDEKGREIPITEEMIQQACEELDEAGPGTGNDNDNEE